MTARVTLKPGRERSALNRHPWVYSGAIKQLEGEPSDGDIVEVADSQGDFVAWGYLNRRSSIAIRLLSWRCDEEIDDRFWRTRLSRSISRRDVAPLSVPSQGGRELVLAADKDHLSFPPLGGIKGGTDAYRLVHAEADGVPGLIVDRYGDWVVAQFLTLGVEVRKQQLTTLLAELLPGIRGIYERSDVDVRKKEGLLPKAGVLTGADPPDEVIILESGLKFAVDLKRGHKTGFYLDQRKNRILLQGYASGTRFLNCFSYTGAFSVYADED